MAIPVDGRERRGLVRRLAYADVARAVGDLPEPPAWMAPSERDLYLKRRREVLAWLARRGNGEMIAPPGGAGSEGGR